MADIAGSDVSYSLQEGTQKTGPDCRYEAAFTITFGDGVLTYPAGGIPLTRGKLGCPTRIEEFSFMDEASANGFHYKYDPNNNKVRIYDLSNVELVGGVATPAAATLRAIVVGW